MVHSKVHSSGMSTDRAGNFYVATNAVGSASLGVTGEGLLAVFTPDLQRFLGGFREGRAALSFRDVAVDLQSQLAYVSLEDAVVRYPLGGVLTSVEAHTPQVPTRLRLAQNYPTPFNPSTTIRFTIPETARTSLVIHNILGEKVATLVDDVLPQGEHQVSWNAAGMASGIYFYTLQFNGLAQTSKLTLLP